MSNSWNRQPGFEGESASWTIVITVQALTIVERYSIKRVLENSSATVFLAASPNRARILFNHESPRRGETFVTRKITRAVARIKAG